VEAVYLPSVPQADSSREIDIYRARLYEAVGRLLVKAIFDEIAVPVLLGLAVFKYFLDQEPSLSDLEQFDPSMVRSLRELLKLDDASLLCLDFSEFGPGDDREVTNQNRKEYVRKKAQQVLFRDRELALVAMKKGFESIPISPQLRMFSADELAQLPRQPARRRRVCAEDLAVRGLHNIGGAGRCARVSRQPPECKPEAVPLLCHRAWLRAKTAADCPKHLE